LTVELGTVPGCYTCFIVVGLFVRVIPDTVLLIGIADLVDACGRWDADLVVFGGRRSGPRRASSDGQGKQRSRRSGSQRTQQEENPFESTER
jgi:hypothetical protein